MKRDHYETLGVGKDAAPAEIKKAFRKKAHECHPDKGGSNESFLALQRAFKTLGDEESRKTYDESGRDAEDRQEADRAEDMLAGLMLKVIAEAPCVDGLDLVKLCGAEIRLIEIQLEIEMRQIPERAAKVKAAVERIRNPGDTFLVEALKRAAAGLEASLETLQRKVELAKEMKRLLEPYRYDFDKRKEPEGYMGPLARFLMQGLKRMAEAGREGREEKEDRFREREREERRHNGPFGSHFGPPPASFDEGW